MSDKTIKNTAETATDLWMDIEKAIARSGLAQIEAMPVLELVLFNMKLNVIDQPIAALKEDEQ